MSVDVIFTYVKENLNIIIVVVVFLVILTFFVDSSNKTKGKTLTDDGTTGSSDNKKLLKEMFADNETPQVVEKVEDKKKQIAEKKQIDETLQKLKSEEEIKREQLELKIKELKKQLRSVKREIDILNERTKDAFISQLSDYDKIAYNENINNEIYVKQIKVEELTQKINKLMAEEAMNKLNNLEAKMDVLQISDGPTLLEIVQTDPRFKTFNMVFSNLATEGLNLEKFNYTLIIPSNKAFERMSDDLKKMLFKYDNKMKMYNLLMYHIIPGIYFGNNLNGKTVQAMNKLDLHFKRDIDDSLYVNSERIVEEDIIGRNGVIHVIDNLLFIPEIIQTFIQPVGNGLKKQKAQKKESPNDYYLDISKLPRAIPEQKKEFVGMSRLDENELDRLRGNQRALMNQLYQIRNSVALLRDRLDETNRLNKVFSVVDITKQLGEYNNKFDLVREVISNNVVDYDRYLKSQELTNSDYESMNNDIKKLSDAIDKIRQKESVMNPIYAYRVVNCDKVQCYNG